MVNSNVVTTTQILLQPTSIGRSLLLSYNPVADDRTSEALYIHKLFDEVLSFIRDNGHALSHPISLAMRGNPFVFWRKLLCLSNNRIKDNEADLYPESCTASF